MRVYNFPSDEIHIKNNKGEEIAKIGPDGVEMDGIGGVSALEEKVFFDGVATIQECPPSPYPMPPLMILGDKQLDGSIKAIDVEFDETYIVANRTLEGDVGLVWLSQNEDIPIVFANVPIYTGDVRTLFSRTLEYEGESIDVSEDFNNLVDNYDLSEIIVKINGQVAQVGDMDTISFYISNASVTRSMLDNTVWSFSADEAGEYTIEATVPNTKQVFVAIDSRKPVEIGVSHSIKISYIAQDSKFAEGSTFVADSLGLINILYNKNINEDIPDSAPKLVPEDSPSPSTA